MSNFSNRLILYNKNTLPKNIESECIKLLQKIHFIGEHITYKNENIFLVGDNFLNLVTFCGCSTNIQTNPDENDSNFIAVKIPHITNDQYFYSGKVPFNYPCSNCKISMNLTNDGKKQFIIEQDDYFTCPQCEHHHFYHKINWRRKAGIGQFFVIIRGVFESEGIPSDELFKNLYDLTNSKWEYYYADSSSL